MAKIVAKYKKFDHKLSQFQFTHVEKETYLDVVYSWAVRGVWK